MSLGLPAGVPRRAPLGAHNDAACACCTIDADFHRKQPCRCPCHGGQASGHGAYGDTSSGAMDENDSMPDWATIGHDGGAVWADEGDSMISVSAIITGAQRFV